VPGATLRYTTNGADPTESDLAVPATGDVLILGTTTLKARAWVPDRTPSVVAAGTYTLQPAAPTLSPTTGTYVGAQTVTLGTCGWIVRYIGPNARQSTTTLSDRTETPIRCNVP
jgi:Chitobiase/beta-hexosaminidase C-terminal domain